MAHVKVSAVKGGFEVRVAVEKGAEHYDQEEGVLYEARRIDVEELKQQIRDAVRRGKELAADEEGEA